MAELNAKARNALPKAEFGEPGSRKYPMNDARHAVLAKGRAHEMLNKGKLSKSTYATILARANRKLGKTAAEG